jgi:hypothetical protein
LRKLFQHGRLQGNATLRRKQYQLATQGDGNCTMLIWLGKQLLGQRDEPATVLNLTATAHADTRTPEQLKDEVINLQRAVFAEAHRLNGHHHNGDSGNDN